MNDLATPRPGGQHEHRGRAAVMRLVEFAPASGSLALWVRHRDVDADQAAAAGATHAPAYTDGLTVHYPPAFEDLDLDVQTGVVAHQVLHVALRHAQRFRALERRLGEADLVLFNRCADAIVNSTLAPLPWLALPAGAPTLPQLLDQALGLTRGDEAALGEWDVERLYAAIDDRRHGGPAPREGGDERREPRPRPSPRDGPRAASVRALGGPRHDDLKPRPEGADAVLDEAGEAREWGERLLRGHTGDGAFSILRTLPRDLPRVRTPWEQVLRTQAARALALKLADNPSRPARSWIANQGRSGRRGPSADAPRGRLPFQPGTTHARRVPRLVLVLDVSGSIDEPLLDRFAAELNALSRRLDAPLVLVVGDEAVRAVEALPPGRLGRERLRALRAGFAGGGGTDFTPLLEEAARHDPDLTVVLTDLEGPARFRPPGTLLWAVPPGAAEPPAPPFGRVLMLR